MTREEWLNLLALSRSHGIPLPVRMSPRTKTQCRNGRQHFSMGNLHAVGRDTLHVIPWTHKKPEECPMDEVRVAIGKMNPRQQQIFGGVCRA